MARTRKEQHFDLYPTILWLLPLFMIALKFTLIRSYHSTDFEVHRNWMAITFNLPIDQWYFANISQWTLDYPPLFAYFEWILSKFAAQIDPSILALKSEPQFSQNVLIFQRFSVIAGNLIYFIGCALVAKNFISWINGQNYRNRLKIGIYSFLITTPALILLDNIHFQYNGLLYGIFLLSLNAIFTGKLIQGAFLFAVLLNFKHIFLYYSPAFIGFYFSAYLLPFNAKFVNRCAKLASVLLFVFSISFGPFLLKGGIPMFKQIISRLFPFKRGLTHANWAPNFWVIYNLADFLSAKLATKIAKNCQKFPWNSILKECPLKSPEYTKGLVQEYSHSILPNISPSITLALVLAFLTPALWIFTKKEFNRNDQFLISLTLSAYSFFLFGWHVHEKAILMIFFPMAFLSIKNLQFFEPFSLISIASTFVQFPLFFTPMENFIKFSLFLAHFALSIFLVNFCWRLHPAELIQTSMGRFLLKMMFAAEIYALILHPLFFGQNQFQFLPIIICSFSCSSTILYSYFYFVLVIFGQQICIQIAKEQIIKKEKKILQNEFHKFDPTNIRHIAGIDLSQCQNSPLAVVTLTILEYPSMKVVYCADEFILLRTFAGHIPPYIPEFLALREAAPLKRAIGRHIQKCPKIDLLFVDSNGKWHSRGCGLACHVGFDTGICTIGVAKTFNGFPLISNENCTKENLKEIEMNIQQKCEQSLDEAALFEFIFGKELPNQQLAIIRTKTSKNPFFISSGFGINFEEAMEFSFECFAKNSNTSNPIRMSDLRSRKLIEEIIELMDDLRIIASKEEACQLLGIEKPPKFIAAPMVRYSKLPFRRLVKSYGCDLIYTPMIYADCYIKSEKCRQVEFQPASDDWSIVQFAAKTPEEFADAAELVYGHCQGIDLNCGCPKSDVRSEGYGSKLLDNPELIADIVRQCRRRIPDDQFSISIKIRIQYPLERTVDLCRKMEHAGVSHIAIHCRTIQQRNEPPDYSAIKLVKDAVQIPIFANGNCKSFLDALEISKLTGADGVMAANGLLDNPALFGGHSTTPKQCVLDWLRLEETENVPFDYFHHLLVFMLRSSLSKQQRKIFNNLRNSTDVREFLSNHYFIDSITL